MESSTSEEIAWRKSSLSVVNGECVEVARDGQAILVRHSKRPDDAVLQFSIGEWKAFIGGVALGEFSYE
ncbi:MULTISPECIES: DUF397 domain-containing protein [Nonomuraea]|uniref:DUF397 domain-containing protein n=1 Tax=Nonomuraea recticatena TaxID=46178 RepID=A0ABN3RLT6_9ACTN